jgi:DNA polymerase-3 subunit epsilon
MDTYIREKGRSIIDFPQNYILIDIETTGLSTEWDEIIEIAALKIKQDKIVDTFSSLVKPQFEIDEFITELTGISNQDLENAPSLIDVLPLFKDFISSSFLIGYNVNFDINFLYDAFLENMNYKMNNDYIDILRIARKVLPTLEHHRLDDLISYYSLDERRLHRALNDCEKTFSVFQSLKEEVLSKFASTEDFKKINHSKSYDEIFKSLKAETDIFDESHPIYNKICVFTGTLEKMSRKEAAQLVTNIGGICKNNITKDTNFLILGNTDYSKNIKGGKSNKQKKAEQLILSGQDLIILPENEFYELINQ